NSKSMPLVEEITALRRELAIRSAKIAENKEELEKATNTFQTVIGLLNGKIQELEATLAGNAKSTESNSSTERTDADTPSQELTNLLAECAGQKSLKSAHGTYLRALDSWKVDMTGSARAWENWYIEIRGGKVVFRAIHSPARYLRAHPNHHVDLTDQVQEWEKFTPKKNEDGSWSFLNDHGYFLSLNEDKSVSTVKECQAWEHIWLEEW
ncbi:hypothetical protein PENTCL1PPCAC_23871, partial [Pristionchus entomophagus]